MSVNLRPMTNDGTARYIAVGLDAYVAEYAASSGEPEEDVRRKAREQYDSYFPDGRPAPGHELLVLECDGESVGRVWVGPHPYRPETPEVAWLYDIEIEAERRGRGHGRKCLELVEAHLSRQGVTELGLNVFAHNDTARRLYASHDYREVAVTMTKALTSQQR